LAFFEIFSGRNDMGKKHKKLGPKTSRLKIDGDWQNAVKKAIGKERPSGCWPDKKKKTQ
jgi:hypothetical protein